VIPAIELTSVTVTMPTGRTLFEDLNLRIGTEHVALVGRNGVGKSTLLSLLAGLREPESGHVRLRSRAHYVAQANERAQPLSQGELRRLELAVARDSGAEILLLDEPTLHLDDEAVEWLRGWLAQWRGCLIVASHDRRLLAEMRHFFVMSEAGCHYFEGSLVELEAHLTAQHAASELRYVHELTRLGVQEEHNLLVARRTARKKRRGRCCELDRATPRIRLNQKRDQAQVSHGRLAKLRHERLAALRSWTQASRRAVNVQLSVEISVPELPADTGQEVLALQQVSATARERQLFESIELRLGRQRVAVVGANGTGKTTLLEIMLGLRRPDRGSRRADLSKIGWIEQGGRNWLLPESLRTLLIGLGLGDDPVARLLVAHRFPLALAERPLRSLSPGERTRAALLALFARTPAIELLILDEPTLSLDLVGLVALTQALKLWRGGLVVASHDRAFLAELAPDRTIHLTGP